MTTQPAIAARELTKAYPAAVLALGGLSLTVPPGQIFGLLGPNGAGKSTTVKILTTLARPDSGSARVAGHDILRHPERVRRSIGVVAQRSGADPNASGRANLLLQGRLHRLRGQDLRRRVDELLARFDLDRYADRPVRGYSGGTQRRLDVALGLVHFPKVLFLDEPTTGLDPQARAAMWDEIGRLARQESLAVLLTTHYLEEAERLAERLAIMEGGRIVAEGTPDTLKDALRGDVLRLELRDQAGPVAHRVLSALPGLRLPSLSSDGRSLTALTDDGATGLPRVLGALDRAGVAATAVSLTRPSLDEVYLHHTGHRPPADDRSPAAVGGS